MSDTALKVWTRVPRGSTLEVSLESASEAWSGSARLIVSTADADTREEQWGHADLNPGPKRTALTTGDGYTVRVRVAFAGGEPARVTVRARIVKPGGSQFGSGYSYMVSGLSPDVERATIIAVLEKGGA